MQRQIEFKFTLIIFTKILQKTEKYGNKEIDFDLYLNFEGTFINKNLFFLNCLLIFKSIHRNKCQLQIFVHHLLWFSLQMQ